MHSWRRVPGVDAKSPRSVAPYRPMPERLRALRAEVPRSPMLAVRFDLADAVGSVPVLRGKGRAMKRRIQRAAFAALAERVIE